MTDLWFGVCGGGIHIGVINTDACGIILTDWEVLVATGLVLTWNFELYIGEATASLGVFFRIV